MGKPDSYCYMAVLDYAPDGVHVTFPDLPGCVTFGATEGEAIKQAREALAFHLWGMEDDGDTPPVPSSLFDLTKGLDQREGKAFLLVETFMPAFREKMANRYVKKTLSIPAWLNAQAESRGINFSQTLQKALKQEMRLA